MEVKFQWTQEMSVNHDIIDSQHKQLLNKLNKLLDAIVKDNAQWLIEEMVEFFENYMQEHLQYEEKYLAEINYPDLEAHHNQHLSFKKKYEEFKSKLDEEEINQSEIVFEIETFMGNWLTQHILQEDKKYAVYAQEIKNK